MHWTEPATADDSHAALEKKLWDAANMLWAGADLKPSEYSPTVLGLIFLRYADVRFAAVEKDLEGAGTVSPSRPSSRRRKIGPTDYHAAGVIYLPENARFAELLSLPEGANTGQAINDAMRAIEKENPDLADVLPKTYHILDSRTLAELLKVMASIPMDKGGDTFGLIYEYFLGKFAMTEGQKGGEFYTPTSIVKLIVEILEPYHGRILDPACGSGGMFIQSARFVEEHRKNPTTDIPIRILDLLQLRKSTELTKRHVPQSLFKIAYPIIIFQQPLPLPLRLGKLRAGQFTGDFHIPFQLLNRSQHPPLRTTQNRVPLLDETVKPLEHRIVTAFPGLQLGNHTRHRQPTQWIDLAQHGAIEFERCNLHAPPIHQPRTPPPHSSQLWLENVEFSQLVPPRPNTTICSVAIGNNPGI